VNATELTAAYVLGELGGAELADFERRLAAEPGLRAEVDAARGTVAQLEALPAHAWPGADLPAPSGAERAPRVARRRLTLRPALAAAALVAVFVVGGAIGALAFSGGDSSPAPAKTVLVLHPLDAPKSSRADLSMPDADTMLLRTHGLPASAAGSYYEVWLMSDGQKLVPVASFRVGDSGEASVEVPLPASPADYRYFDVSRQTVAGGTDHSADSVLRGSTSGLS
jgi:anti-sigma-K factor RskA